MNHKEAVNSLAVERYLLGELKDEERAAFEEHYLNCAECLDAVTFGDEFMEAAQPVARELAMAAKSGHAPVREREPGSFFGRLLAGFRSPALAWAMAFVLGAVATYQGFRQEKEVHPETRSILTGISHGTGEAKLVRTSRDNILSLGVEYSRSGDFLSYKAQILSESGKVIHTIALPGNETGNMASIAFLAKTLGPGRYSVVIKGKTVDGEEKEVGRGVFTLQFENQ
jgi:hypothetical protein